MPSRLSWALAAALAFFVAGPVGAAAAAPYTVKALTFNVLTGPDGKTPCRIVADLYKPNDASASNPAAAILATNGFGGSKADFDKIGPAYASRGFVFLAYSGLGFGGSDCKIELDDPDWDGRAGSQLVSFLGGSKAATDGTKVDYVIHDKRDHDGVARSDDPRVGMLGGSYGGEIQFSIAGQDPRVDALNPQITWNDLSYSLGPNNTDFTSGVTYRTPGVTKLDWPVLFFGEGVGQGIEEAFTEQDPSHLGSCPNFDDRVCTSLVQSGSTGYPDPTTLQLLRHASVATYMHNIKIPTFLAQGQSDTLFDLQEAVATWRSLRAQNTPVKMLWRSSGHSGGDLGGQESSDTNPESAYESRMELEWFDYYLRGLGDPPALDVSFLRDWALPKSGDAAPAVGVTPSYPVGAPRSLYLSGTDALADTPGAVKAGTASMAAVPDGPTSTAGGFVDAGTNDAPGTFVDYSTPPLTHDTDVAGIPSVTVHLSAPTFASAQAADPATHLVLFAKLLDVDGSGTATLPRNLASAVRVADVTKPVTIELPGIVHRFAAGHQIRLELTTGDAQFHDNNFGGPVSVAVDPSQPSVLTIPVLGAQIGPAGGASDGLTRFAAAPGSPASQPAGLGGPAVARAAATLPRVCASRRVFRIHLRRAPRGDRIRSAAVTVNGRSVRFRGRRRLGATVDLRGLPKGTFRVVVTVRTKRGRTLRSARTYHTCVPSRG